MLYKFNFILGEDTPVEVEVLNISSKGTELNITSISKDPVDLLIFNLLAAETELIINVAMQAVKLTTNVEDFNSSKFQEMRKAMSVEDMIALNKLFNSPPNVASNENNLI